jgi:hypothetical protein
MVKLSSRWITCAWPQQATALSRRSQAHNLRQVHSSVTHTIWVSGVGLGRDTMAESSLTSDCTPVRSAHSRRLRPPCAHLQFHNRRRRSNHTNTPYINQNFRGFGSSRLLSRVYTTLIFCWRQCMEFFFLGDQCQENRI